MERGTRTLTSCVAGDSTKRPSRSFGRYSPTLLKSDPIIRLQDSAEDRRFNRSILNGKRTGAVVTVVVSREQGPEEVRGYQTLLVQLRQGGLLYID